MSNFLNFYSDPSSQGSDGLRMIDSSILRSDAKEGEVDTGPEAVKQSSEEEQRKALMEEVCCLQTTSHVMDT